LPVPFEVIILVSISIHFGKSRNPYALPDTTQPQGRGKGQPHPLSRLVLLCPLMMLRMMRRYTAIRAIVIAGSLIQRKAANFRFLLPGFLSKYSWNKTWQESLLSSTNPSCQRLSKNLRMRKGGGVLGGTSSSRPRGERHEMRVTYHYPTELTCCFCPCLPSQLRWKIDTLR